jgi:aspartate/methionine/tyrosine aminotransferase
MSSMPPSRLPSSFDPNPLTLAVRRARSAGRRLLDLTSANPTHAGFSYPAGLLDGLATPASLRYDPEPLGLRAAREAVAADYARRGVSIDPERIVLTASTSEAYGWLFKLLCKPDGDTVLIPTPSYPLFDHLTRLEGVLAEPYCLEYHGRWLIDFESVDSSWTDEVRAMLVVSPNNPTGSEIGQDELTTIAGRCAYYGAALIIDEVFADYPLRPGASRRAEVPAECLAFRLGGLSKSAGLPQLKLGWIAVSGPDEKVGRVLQHLELIADTYLSVSTPVQVAAPSLIVGGADVRAQILGRVQRNYAALSEAAARYPAVEVLRADAGWSAVLRVPASVSEEALAIELLEQDDVLVHPGFFFDFPHEAFLVVSLLPAPDEFDDGVGRVIRRAGG